jgi:hypothetical protein
VDTVTYEEAVADAYCPCHGEAWYVAPGRKRPNQRQCLARMNERKKAAEQIEKRRAGQRVANMTAEQLERLRARKRETERAIALDPVLVEKRREKQRKGYRFRRLRKALEGDPRQVLLPRKIHALVAMAVGGTPPEQRAAREALARKGWT